MMLLRFTKMHGAGNDFVVVDDRPGMFEITPDRARRILDRRFGVGGDQLLVIREAAEADFEMRIHNNDGSEVEMCGNGIRCAALFARTRGIVNHDEMAVHTLAGMIKPVIVGDLVRVDMGAPIFDGRAIPVNLDDEIMDREVVIGGIKTWINCVSMGNPHCVIYVDDTATAAVTTFGPVVENDALFPRRINVEFVKVVNRSEINMRVWERGSGETLACGTGACAAAVVSIKRGFTDRKVTVHLTGGDLVIEWPENSHVFMTGPASEVYNGEMEIS